MSYIYIIQLDSNKCNSNVFKIGSTKDINRRKWDYITSHHYNCKYIGYFELIEDDCYKIDHKLRTEWLVDKNIYNGYGIEFYQFQDAENPLYIVRNILVSHDILCIMTVGDNIISRPSIESYKSANCVDDQQHELAIDNDEPRAASYWIEESEDIVLRQYQTNAIDAITATESDGKIIMCCGSGKTIIMKHISAGYKRNLILVPSLLLLNQIANQMNQYILRIGSSNNATTDKAQIKQYISNNPDTYFIISTYQSAHLLIEESVEFDLIQFDEAHRTVGQCIREYSIMLRYDNNKAGRKLFYTATEYIIKSDASDVDDADDKFISMDDDVYGETLFEYAVDEAINNKYLTDYNVVIMLKNKVNVINQFFDENKIKKLLIFCNSNREAEYVAGLVNGIYLSGEMSMRYRLRKIQEFKQADKSIIVSCRIFQEGIDIPCCDSVMFYDDRSSYIDIVQIIGRCLRLYNGKYISHIFINEDANVILRVLNGMDIRFMQRIRRISGHNSNRRRIEGSVILDNNEHIDADYCEYDVYDRLLTRIGGSWYNKLDQVKRYIDEHKKLPTIKTDTILCNWINTQNKNHKAKKYGMNDISIYNAYSEFKEEYKEYFISNDDKWHDMLDQIKRYIDEHKKLPTLKTDKILRQWIYNQNKNHKAKKKAMSNISIYNAYSEFKEEYKEYFISNDDKWHDMLDQIKRYIDENKKLPTIKTDKILCNWIGTQNQNHKNKKEAMKNVSIYNAYSEFKEEYKEYFISNDDKWHDMLDQIKRYIDENKKLPTIKTDKILCNWINLQNINYKAKKQIMNNISIYNAYTEFKEEYSEYFISNDDKWHDMLDQVKRYIDENKKLPTKMTNKILRKWISHQNENHKAKKQIMNNISIYNAYTAFKKEYSEYF